MSGITDPFSTLFLQVRSVKPVITVNNQDVTAVVYPSLTSLTYKEGIGSQGGEKSALADIVVLELADSEASQPIGRADQHDHPDAYMIAKICSENDAIMKVRDDTLWVRSMSDIENQPPVGTFICPTEGNPGGLNGRGILDWEFTEQTEDCNYMDCTVSYKDPSSGKVASATTTDPNATSGPHLKYKYNQHDSVAQPSASQLAHV